MSGTLCEKGCVELIEMTGQHGKFSKCEVCKCIGKRVDVNHRKYLDSLKKKRKNNNDSDEESDHEERRKKKKKSRKNNDSDDDSQANKKIEIAKQVHFETLLVALDECNILSKIENKLSEVLDTLKKQQQSS